MSIVKDLQRPTQTALRTTDLNTEEDQTPFWNNLNKITQTAGKLAIGAMSEEIKNEKSRAANEVLGNTTQDLYDYLSSSDLTPEEQNNAVQMTTSNLYKAGFKSSDIEAAYKLRGITDEKLLKDIKQAIDRNEEDQIQRQKNLEEAALTTYPDLSTQEAVQAYTKDLMNQKMLADTNTSLENASPKTQELSWAQRRPQISEEIVNQLRVATREINGNWTEAALIDAEAQLTKQLLSKYPTMPTSMARHFVSDSIQGLRRAAARTKGNMEELEKYYDKSNKIMTDEALNGLLQKEFTVTHGNQTYTTTGAQLLAAGKILPDETTAALLQKTIVENPSVTLGQIFSDQKVDRSQIRQGYSTSSGRSLLQNFPAFVNMTEGQQRENAIDVGLETANINTENLGQAPREIRANQYATPLATVNAVINETSAEDLSKKHAEVNESYTRATKAYAQAGSQDTFMGGKGLIIYDVKSQSYKYVEYDENQGVFIDRSADGKWIALGSTPSVKFRDSLPQLKDMHDNLVGKGIMSEEQFGEWFNNIMYTSTAAGQKLSSDLALFNTNPEAYRGSRVFPADPKGKTIEAIPIIKAPREFSDYLVEEASQILKSPAELVVDSINKPMSPEEVQRKVEEINRTQQTAEKNATQTFPNEPAVTVQGLKDIIDEENKDQDSLNPDERIATPANAIPAGSEEQTTDLADIPLGTEARPSPEETADMANRIHQAEASEALIGEDGPYNQKSLPNPVEGSKKTERFVKNDIVLTGKPGQEVKSPVTGVIAFAGKIRGKDVVLIQDTSIKTGKIWAFSELIPEALRRGDNIKEGQPIGSTNSKGAVRIALSDNQKRVDPSKYFM